MHRRDFLGGMVGAGGFLLAQSPGTVAATVPAPSQPDPPDVFCWHELFTSDPESAIRFYTSLFDWTSDDVGGYRRFLQGGQALAGLLPQLSLDSARWNPMVRVPDLAATVARLVERKGHVVRPPYSELTPGRRALVRDPNGASLALLQAGSDPPRLHLRSPASAVVWNELVTPSARESAAFYDSLFRWGEHFGPNGYRVLHGKDKPVGGVAALSARWRDFLPQWVAFFAVPDPDQAARTAQQLGGQVVVGVRTLPSVGRFALLRDPMGALFGVLTPWARIERP